MHSSLSPHLHVTCVDIIKAFEKCHEEHTIGKFFGQCNDLKYQLSRCFAEDTADRRRKNREQATIKKKKFAETYRKYLGGEDE